jgi:hypothetical protein
MVADRVSGLLQRPTVVGGGRFGPLAQVRWLQVALWLLVISGPIAATVLAFGVGGLDSRVDGLARQPAAAPTADSAGAEGFAELYVASVLAADADTAVGLSGIGELPAGGVAEGGWLASRTVSLGAEELTAGYFAVTVAVEVLAENTDSQPERVWVAVGTRFYTVGVVETDSGWVATGLPTLVARPTGPPAPELLVMRMDGLDAFPELERAVAAFLAAYLTGVGDLHRYTVPGSLLVPVEPVPFVAVEITRAGSATSVDGTQHVAALVRAMDAAGRSQVLEYSLVVSQRDGRWEVAELLSAAPLGNESN